MGVELCHGGSGRAYRWPDMKKLIFAFRNFSNAPNKMHFLRATCFEEGTDTALPLISNLFSMTPLHDLPQEQALTLTHEHALCDKSNSNKE